MNNTILRGLFGLLLLFAVGCQGQQSPSEPPAEGGPSEIRQPETAVPNEIPTDPTVEAVPAATPTTNPTPIPVPEPQPILLPGLEEDELTLPDLPPHSYYDLVERGVELSLWDFPQGIIQVMRFMVGEQSSLPLPAESAGHSMSGVLRSAADLLADPLTSEADRAEIERLFQRLVPGQEALDLLSEPADRTEAANKMVRANLAHQGDSCADLAGAGYDVDEVTRANITCFKFKETEVNGETVRVYYPKYFEDQERLMAFVDTALEASAKSLTVYDDAGLIGDANVIFSLKPDADDKATLAAQIPFNEGENCPLVLYPASNPGESIDSFKQTIAHEFYHCYQEWNFDVGSYDVNKWWLEGSAEYFSNVVYPDVNDELSRIRDFEVSSVSKTILEMDYENFLFFQHLGNSIGDQEIDYLLGQIAAQKNSKSGQQAALAAYPNMGEIFQDFVVTFFSSGIQDSGGSRIQPVLMGVTKLIKIGDRGDYPMTVRAFQVGRFGLIYEQEKRFMQEVEVSGNGFYSAVVKEERMDRSKWSDLPKEIRSKCDEPVKYLQVVTTIQEKYTYTVKVNEAERASCDPCLLGHWAIDNESFARRIEALFAANAGADLGGLTLKVEVSGADYVTFQEDGKFTTQRVGFKQVMTVNGMRVGGGELGVSTDAKGGGEYAADGDFLTVMSIVSNVDQVTATFNDDVPVETAVLQDDSATFTGPFGTYTTEQPNELDDSQSKLPPYPYLCDAQTLMMVVPDFGEIQLNRTDEIPPTPVPTAAP
ncbi:MAG: hypothetical protein QNJ45_15755 [Ardenticatenaceae bacterium]|nr:hypothetical protein [Ardenticatenaceae bacterium]